MIQQLKELDEGYVKLLNYHVDLIVCGESEDIDNINLAV
jgi:hypothetical protein